jgi:hypothetical protein
VARRVDARAAGAGAGEREEEDEDEGGWDMVVVVGCSLGCW